VYTCPVHSPIFSVHAIGTSSLFVTQFKYQGPIWWWGWCFIRKVQYTQQSIKNMFTFFNSSITRTWTYGTCNSVDAMVCVVFYLSNARNVLLDMPKYTNMFASLCVPNALSHLCTSVLLAEYWLIVLLSIAQHQFRINQVRQCWISTHEDKQLSLTAATCEYNYNEQANIKTFYIKTIIMNI